jgi:hypothetical protein
MSGRKLLAWLGLVLGPAILVAVEIHPDEAISIIRTWVNSIELGKYIRREYMFPDELARIIGATITIIAFLYICYQRYRSYRWIFTWKRSEGGYDLFPFRRLIALRAAASYAYQKTRNSRVAAIFESPTPSGKSVPLDMYAQALVGPQYDINLYGMRLPFSIIEKVSKDTVVQCGIAKDGDALIPYGRQEPVYDDLHIKHVDFKKRLRQIRRLAGGSQKIS